VYYPSAYLGHPRTGTYFFQSFDLRRQQNSLDMTGGTDLLELLLVILPLLGRHDAFQRSRVDFTSLWQLGLATLYRFGRSLG
jgi:hypothetical protein